MSTLVVGRRVVLPTGIGPATLEIESGRIACVHERAPRPLGPDDTDIGNLLVSPGIVDSHVHINEPGRTEWEGFSTATEAAAAGGITTVVDMPLNCIPATTSRAAAEAKLAALHARAPTVDVAFWGGVVPGNAAELKGLRDFGVGGAKCFLCPSGVEEFQHVGGGDLETAMPIMRDLGLTLLVHAELSAPLEAAERSTAALDPKHYATYLASRPATAEDEAIALIIKLCERFNARAHIVHLGSASALPLLAAAQARGVSISAETCLHYLTFCAEEIEDGRTDFKCAPPIRDRNNREGLWEGLRSGVISMVVSDHSPCTPALKQMDTGNFVAAWGGISSLQLGLSALWTEASKRGFSAHDIARWNAQAPAALSKLFDRKGSIEVGKDADFVIWDDQATFEVAANSMRHRHKVTPYATKRLTGMVEQTWLRGTRIFDRASGSVTPGRGQFLRAGAP